MENALKDFKILCIDGGGIRGLYPATYLSELEHLLKQERGDGESLYNYFDLICGTSTGGIIAIALALGMPAKQIQKLYENKANIIFGKKQTIFGFRKSTYSNRDLESLIKEEFGKFTQNQDTRLGHAKTRLCIPVFNANESKINVLKTAHHKNLIRDYQIPAYQVAMATSAAPTYFDPYNISFKRITDEEQIDTINNVDGGVFANNPTLIGLLEAKGLGYKTKNIRILSLGTGIKKYEENRIRGGWGIKYWMIQKKRLIDLIFQSQSEMVENYLQIFKKGIGGQNDDDFFVERIQPEFRSENDVIDLACTDAEKLRKFKIKAQAEFKVSGKRIYHNFLESKITNYTPFNKV